MIAYDPGWLGIRLLCRLKGSVIKKTCVWTVPCCLLSIVLQWTLHHEDVRKGFGTEEQSGEEAQNNERDREDQASLALFAAFASILGYLIALRLQQAYSRWWEGATVLHHLCAEWSHSFGTLMAFCSNDPARYDEVRQFQQQIVRLYSLLFGCAMAQLSPESCEVLDLEGFPVHALMFLRSCDDPCEVVMLWIQKLILENNATEVVHVQAPILARVFEKLGDGMINLKAAKVIKDYHIPFPLAQVHMMLLLMMTSLVPVWTAGISTTPAGAAVLTFLLIFSYWSALYICLDLEEPFADNPNNLPMLDEEKEFNIGLCTLMNPWSQKVPPFKSRDADEFDIKRQCISLTLGGTPVDVDKFDSKNQDISFAPGGIDHHHKPRTTWERISISNMERISISSPSSDERLGAMEKVVATKESSFHKASQLAKEIKPLSDPCTPPVQVSPSHPENALPQDLDRRREQVSFSTWSTQSSSPMEGTALGRSTSYARGDFHASISGGETRSNEHANNKANEQALSASYASILIV